MHSVYTTRHVHTNGSRPCKNRKIKCGEEKPSCLNCEKQGDTCDYSIRLNWFRSDSNQHSLSSVRPLLSTRSLSEGQKPLKSGMGVIEPLSPGGASSASLPQQTPSNPSSSPSERPVAGQKRHHTDPSNAMNCSPVPLGPTTGPMSPLSKSWRLSSLPSRLQLAYQRSHQTLQDSTSTSRQMIAYRSTQ